MSWSATCVRSKASRTAESIYSLVAFPVRLSQSPESSWAQMMSATCFLKRFG
jgi:hypothetical protein